MQIQECFAGQRVMYRETGKAATVKEVDLDKREVHVVFDNASRAIVQARLLEPLQADEPAATGPTGPMRPCPQCGAKMPAAATTCLSCGFQYGVAQPRGGSGIAKFAAVVIILAGIFYVVWKFVLRERLPW
jgi:hypothetical protein